MTPFGPDDLVPSLEEEPWSLDFDVVRLQVEGLTLTAEAHATVSASGFVPIV